MAVIEDKYLQTTGGIRKNIDEDSMPLALDILQRGLYAFPVQSTIRELASNARDAIVERDVAKKILSKEDTVEQHFDVEKIDGIYHSSGWDPDYFDVNWLSKDKNVYIYYEEGKLKDTLRIVDHGVGLGKDRLVGYFQLNFSTKRTNRDSLGKWGLGSKVALSLNVPSFRVASRYNGKRLTFDVFLDKVDSVTPKFSSGKLNDTIDLTSTTKAHYEVTKELNGLEIEVQVKKHNKQQFFDAVKSQLMYMPNIVFRHKKEGDINYKTISIAAKTLYKDANVVISESTIYDKPHILLGAGEALVNYGFVAFDELEIEPKQGSVGLILDINDIEVTPSREAPVWSAKTRAAVLKKYTDVSLMAAEYINKELASEKDYLKWILKAGQTMVALHSGNNDSVVGKLASIIDSSAIQNIKYPLDASIEFSNKPLIMFGDRVAVRLVEYDSGSRKIKRKAIDNMTSLSKSVYITTEKADLYKDRYIWEEFGDFILIQLKEGYATDFFAKLILASHLPKSYSTVVVPEDTLEMYKAVISDDDIEATGVGMSDSDGTDSKAAALQRKLDAKILLHKMNLNGSTYVFSSKELPILDLSTEFPSDVTVLYGTSNDRRDLKELALMFPQGFLRANSPYGYQSQNNNHLTFYDHDKSIDMVITAEENTKHLEASSKFVTPFQYIVKSYNKVTGALQFSDDLVAIATAAVANSMINNSIAHDFHEDNMTTMDTSIQLWYSAFEEGWKRQRPLRYANKVPFYRTCIELDMISKGLLNGDVTELLETINEDLPGILCGEIDYITSVNILDVAKLNKLQSEIDYYSPIQYSLSIYLNKYFGDDDLQSKHSVELLKLLTLAKENSDESVQQSDNTEDAE